MAVSMGLAAKLSDAPDFAERRRLSGERGARANCLNCGGLITLPMDAPVGYGGDTEHQFDCPRCRSLYSLDSADHHSVSYELAVVQNEHRGKRVAPSKPKAVKDPVYDPIRRAQERLAAAQRDIERLMYAAHTEHKDSIRKVATNTGESKSRVHELIRRERERVGNRKPRRTDHAPALAVVENDLPF